jgi:hypothetical protein
MKLQLLAYLSWLLLALISPANPETVSIALWLLTFPHPCSTRA